MTHTITMVLRRLGAACLASLLLTGPARAAPPGWWAGHVDYISREGGTWVTPNPAAAGDPAAPDSFGMTWTATNDGYGLSGRLYGLKDGREVAEFWTFREFYHPGDGRIIFEQWGGPGAYGLGETVMTGPGAFRIDQTFWLADGRNWRERHEAAEGPGGYETRVFDIGAKGELTVQGLSLWRRRAPGP